MNDLKKSLEARLNRFRAAESDLENIRAFEAAGGQYRLTVSCDHPDSSVVALIERLSASTRLKKESLLQVLVAVAIAEKKEAYLALVEAVGNEEGSI